MNIVLDDAVEEKDGGEKVKLGMVVCFNRLYAIVSRKKANRCLGHPR